jgi:hypothetical protein
MRFDQNRVYRILYTKIPQSKDKIIFPLFDICSFLCPNGGQYTTLLPTLLLSFPGTLVTALIGASPMPWGFRHDIGICKADQADVWVIYVSDPIGKGIFAGVYDQKTL